MACLTQLLFFCPISSATTWEPQQRNGGMANPKHSLHKKWERIFFYIYIKGQINSEIHKIISSQKKQTKKMSQNTVTANEEKNHLLMKQKLQFEVDQPPHVTVQAAENPGQASFLWASKPKRHTWFALSTISTQRSNDQCAHKGRDDITFPWWWKWPPGVTLLPRCEQPCHGEGGGAELWQREGHRTWEAEFCPYIHSFQVVTGLENLEVILCI